MTEHDSDPLVQPIAPGPTSAPRAGGGAGMTSPETSGRGHRDGSENMLPQRERRRSWPERMLVRLIATCGVVGIGVAIGAIMTSAGSQGWMVGLVVAVVSVVLAALLWSSRML